MRAVTDKARPGLSRGSSSCTSSGLTGTAGAACRYVWAACSVRPTYAHNAVAKFDTQQRAVQVRHVLPRCGSGFHPHAGTLCKAQAALLPALAVGDSVSTRLASHPPASRSGTSPARSSASLPLFPRRARQQVRPCTSAAGLPRFAELRERLGPALGLVSLTAQYTAQPAEDDGVVLVVLVQASGDSRLEGSNAVQARRWVAQCPRARLCCPPQLWLRPLRRRMGVRPWLCWMGAP